jgi:alanyl-tRNA synthetase
MTVKKIREKYIEFFKEKPRNHKEISPALLVPPEDPTTLFTSSGMQQLVPFLTGESHPEGKRLVNSQPCIRVQDIDEVGDGQHTTFFEMLGNWSLGDYFKEEQLSWIWEFLTKELELPKDRLWVSVFEGAKEVPKDEESAKVWRKIGVPKDKLFYYGVKENWWSRSGTPDKMPVGEIGGPDSEVFFEFSQVKHNPKFGKECHPNCQCGRFLEVGNSVFIQYLKKKDGSLKELPQKNVDFGGGLERLGAAINDNPDVFQIDIYKPNIKLVEEIGGKQYEGNESAVQIILDHMRAASALIKEGVVPGNKLQGYVLRRLIRRAAVKMRSIKGNLDKSDLNLNVDSSIGEVVEDEVGRFSNSLEKGLKQVAKIDEIDAKKAFDLYQTYGFPIEITEELFFEKGQKIDKKGFEKEFEKHKKLSRTASAGMFKGGLADKSEEVTKLHTATHLLHASLRKVLGEHVQQKGSNIITERLRFDFTHPEKLKDKEIKKVEKMINRQIEKDLPVNYETKTYKEAITEGALAFFGERYGEKVKVYTIGSPSTRSSRSGLSPFSREVCGGPHVKRTGEIGHVKIKKQEKIGSGLVRMYAAIE